MRDSRGFSHSPGSRLTINPDHHVTEAIGDMYGDFDEQPSNRARYSYMASTPGQDANSRDSRRQSTLSVPCMRAAAVGVGGGLSGAVGRPSTPPQQQQHTQHQSTHSPSSPRSASISPSRSNGDAANQKFPLSDIDYESDPVAVAQEISNLQALRRMSMDVTAAADPDLPSFNSFVPSMPPADGGGVFWVPARLHPELAPQEFSAYLEAKKNEIRRPKGARDGSLSPDGASTGAPSLRRKKSMLSRQIDTDAGKGYRDGAERLEKRASLRAEGNTAIQLEDFMNDPAVLMHKLSVDSQRRIEEGAHTSYPFRPSHLLNRDMFRRSGGRRPNYICTEGRIETLDSDTLPQR